MNKFKKILLGALSVLTLGLVAVTGAKVEAATTTYTLKPLDFYKTNATKEYGSITGTDKTSVESANMSYSVFSINQQGGHYYEKLWDDSSNLSAINQGNSSYTIDSNSYGMRFGTTTIVTFDIPADATAVLDIVLYGTVKDSKGSTGSVLKSNVGDKKTLYTTAASFDSGLVNEVSVLATSNYSKNKFAIDTLLDVKLVDLDSSNNSISFASFVGFAEMNLTITSTKTNVDFVNEAKDAIDAIPNINDGFDEYEIAINVAKNAIKACENGIDDLDDIHKEKYNNALAIYNEAKNSILIEENNSRFGNVSKFTANDVAVGATSNTSVSSGTSNLGESIFIGEKYTKQIVDSNNVSTSATIFGTEYNGRLKIEGKNAIKFTTTSSGAISFIALSGSGSDPNRRFVLFEENGTTVIDAVIVPTNLADAKVQVINVPSAGTYYIGATNASGDSKGINIYELSFISNSVKSLSQTYTDSNYTYIRFVTIVKGEAELTSSKFNFGVTMTYTDSSTRTVDYTNNEKLYVVKKITSSGENYVGNVNSQSYEFANHVAEYYVVFILRLTTSTFAGCSVCSNFTYNGLTLHSSSETI